MSRDATWIPPRRRPTRTTEAEITRAARHLEYVGLDDFAEQAAKDAERRRRIQAIWEQLSPDAQDWVRLRWGTTMEGMTLHSSP